MTKMTIFLFLATLFSPMTLSAEEKPLNISTKTAVIFNTLCAKCHEGECSGRLSFDTGSKAASSHIKRYAGDATISKVENKEFFTLLNHMKTKCALIMPDGDKWTQENLAHFALPSSKGYFIPLGLLRSGKYLIVIKTEEKIHFKVEVISDHFDSYLGTTVCPDQKENNLGFTLDGTTNTFLRINSKKPLHITILEIKSQDE